MPKPTHTSATRQLILEAALKLFAHQGYAATSVQQIVDEAAVSKPALYYYFADKAALYQALVDWAHEERYRIMSEAAGRHLGIQKQLVDVLEGLFDFLARNRSLLRIAFATTLAAPGELPEGLRYTDKCERNFSFIKDLMGRALSGGELDSRHTAEELAFGFCGLMSTYMVNHLLMPDCALDRGTAERVVQLFLSGAATKTR